MPVFLVIPSTILQRNRECAQLRLWMIEAYKQRTARDRECLFNLQRSPELSLWNALVRG